MRLLIAGLWFLVFTLPAVCRTLQAGDVLEISVAGNAALSKKVVVADDGTLDYPLLLDRSVIGMSVSDLMDQLSLAVAKSDPANMVVVNMLSDTKLKVNVLGQVKKPGLLFVNKGASLQEVLMMAEGFNEYSDLTNVKLIRKGKSPDEAQTVSLEPFMAEGDLTSLPEVREGDTYVLVRAKQSKTVKVLGAVRSPGFYAAAPNANLFDMIQVAGGQMDNADLTKVRHITTIDGKRMDEAVDLRHFWEELGDTEKIPKVKEGDMIIVYKKTITWSVFMEYVRDAVSLFTVYLLITSYTSK
ncbi:MAG: SLBB domain-containing protein [Fibrobacterota bacterium]